MAEMKLPMMNGDRNSDLDYRDNLPVNMTGVIKNIKGDQGYLLTHDGLTEFSQVNGVARGGVFNERFNQHYRVGGNFFESIASDGAVTVLGQINGTDPCNFASSFNTQAILSDGRLFYWDSSALRQVTDSDLGFPIDITWFRGIYVMTDGESLFHTDINDEYSISPLKYSSSEFSSDSIKAVARNDQNQILAFNRYSIEYFFFNPNVPTGTSVLQSISGKSTKIGIIGTNCQTEMDGMFFILGGRKEESPSIHILNGGQEATIATREIDKILGQYSEQDLSKAYLESRVVDRDKFLIVHLPDYTLLYNHTVGSKFGGDVAWTYVKTGVDVDEPWRAKYGVFDPRNALWIYGDLKENKLAYLNDKLASQYDEQVENICYTPMLPIEGASIDSFEIGTIAGFSNSDVTCFYSMSQDGVSYGFEYTNLVSTSRNYNTRYIARRIGYIRDTFNFKFRLVSHYKVAFSGLTVNYS